MKTRNTPVFLALTVAALAGSACKSNSSLDLQIDEASWEGMHRGEHATYVEAVNVMHHALAHASGDMQLVCSTSGPCELHAESGESPCFCVHQVGKINAQPPDWNDHLGLSGILMAPFAALFEGLRYAWVEDADSLLVPTNFQALVMFDRQNHELAGEASAPEDSKRLDDVIDLDEPFEIVLRFLAVDNFSEGRLRDELGGDGGELSLMVSLNALSENGELIRDDQEFLIRESLRRRSPLLAALRATKKGSQAADRIERSLREFAAFRGEAKHEVARLREELERRRAQGEEGLQAWVASAVGKANRKLESKLQDLLSKRALPEELSSMIERADLARLYDELASAWSVQPRPRVAAAERGQALRADESSRPSPETLEELDQAMEQVSQHLAGLEQIIERLERYGYDQQGAYEQVEVVKGLADSDHSWEFEADNVRPQLVKHGGTAAVVWCRDPNGSAPDSDVVRESGVIFRGTLDELSTVSGSASGLSLSVLLMERDDDQFVKAIELVNGQTENKDLGIDGIDAGAILDALSLIGERIAQDDVELRAIDLRFLCGEVSGPSDASREVFRFKPCTIVLGRNCHRVGARARSADFGALAILQIRSTDPRRERARSMPARLAAQSKRPSQRGPVSAAQ